MVRTIEDILENIAEAIEPLDLVDRLNISVEELMDGFDISTEELVDTFKDRIIRNLSNFDDVYVDEDEYDGNQY